MSEELKASMGAWVITDVFSKHGIRITVKASGDDTAAAIGDLYGGIAHGIDKYGWTTEQQGAPKAQVIQPPVPAAPVAVVGNAPAVVDTSLNTLEVVRVIVTPKPDDKVELQLFGRGHQYADLYHNGTIAQVMTALTGTGLVWEREMLQKANEFHVNFFADWRNSEKLNTKGKPYKNIVGYRSAEATA